MGLDGPYLFGVLVTIAITTGVTIQDLIAARARVLCAREETKRAEAKAAAKRAEAEVRTVAAWTPPVDTAKIQWATITDGRLSSHALPVSGQYPSAV